MNNECPGDLDIARSSRNYSLPRARQTSVCNVNGQRRRRRRRWCHPSGKFISRRLGSGRVWGGGLGFPVDATRSRFGAKVGRCQWGFFVKTPVDIVNGPSAPLPLRPHYLRFVGGGIGECEGTNTPLGAGKQSSARGLHLELQPHVTQQS